MSRLTRPFGMRLTDWADQAVRDLEPYGVAGRLMNEAQWQDWGVQFLNNATLGRNLPNPYNFTTWREWAERMCESLA